MKGSIAELARAGVTTAVLNLTIDDCDWVTTCDICKKIPQKDTEWGVRFAERRKALDSLAASGKIVIVKRLSDIPVLPSEVRKARRAGRVAISISLN